MKIGCVTIFANAKKAFFLEKKKKWGEKMGCVAIFANAKRAFFLEKKKKEGVPL